MQHHRIDLTTAMLYNIDDPTDLLKLILVFQSGTAPIEAIRNMPLDELEELECRIPDDRKAVL
jgi:hypothetical protein